MDELFDAIQVMAFFVMFLSILLRPKIKKCDSLWVICLLVVILIGARDIWLESFTNLVGMLFKMLVLGSAIYVGIRLVIYFLRRKRK